MTRDLAALAVENQRLVWKRVHVLRRGGSREDYEDDFQNGMIGFLKCLEKWDPEQSQLSSWAVPAIDWAIRRGRYNQRGIGYRQHVDAGVYWVDPLSLDKPIDEDGRTLADLLECPAPAQAPNPLLVALLDSMSDVEKVVMLESFEVAAADLGSSVAAIRRRHYRMRHRLRERLEAQGVVS